MNATAFDFYSFILWAVLILLIVQTVFILWLSIRARKLRKRLKNKPKAGRKTYQPHTEDTSLLYESNELYYIANQAVHVMEVKKLFLNPQLRIADLSKAVGTNRNYLSKAINDCFMLNFSQLCNYFRVKEACVLYLSQPGISRREWVDRSGFKSFSSFSNAFGNFTKRSPVKWQREVRQRLKNKETISVYDYIKDLTKV
ncbi:MAG: helix-turn-helix domain-containing protein [Bacteroidales bacterium]|nr:helix-turn-helix domain-containing protein [Bacteroidales bacterium]